MRIVFLSAFVAALCLTVPAHARDLSQVVVFNPSVTDDSVSDDIRQRTASLIRKGLTRHRDLVRVVSALEMQRVIENSQAELSCLEDGQCNQRMVEQLDVRCKIEGSILRRKVYELSLRLHCDDQLVHEADTTFTGKSQRPSIAKLVSELARSFETGLLIVKSHPRGAEVLLDGEPQPGRTPTRLKVDPGQHTITIRKQHHISTKKDVTISAAQVMYVPVIKLRPLPTELDVRAHTRDHKPLKGARIFIDKVLKGQTPYRLQVPAGVHTVRLELNGYAPVSQTVETMTGVVKKMDIQMGRIGQAPQQRRTSRRPAPTGCAEIMSRLYDIGERRRAAKARMRESNNPSTRAAYDQTVRDWKKLSPKARYMGCKK